MFQTKPLRQSQGLPSLSRRSTSFYNEIKMTAYLMLNWLVLSLGRQTYIKRAAWPVIFISLIKHINGLYEEIHELTLARSD